MKPKTISYKISEKRVKTIIAEELKNKLKTEAIDHEGAKTVVNGASKLLKAAEAFKEDANGGMQSAVTPHLDQIINALEQMISNPASYTDKVKVEPKRVKLRRIEEANDLHQSLREKYELKKLNERARYNWKPEAKEFMQDLLRTKTKTVPVGSKSTKIADTLQDLGMLRVVKQFKGPSGLVVVYEATNEGREEFEADNKMQVNDKLTSN